MSSTDNTILTEKVSITYPLGVNKAFPIDARSFFTSYETALDAVRDAVELDVDEYGSIILPSDENGGSDSIYYYGEVVVVTTNGGENTDIYVVVKKYDENNEPYGTLERPSNELLSQLVTETQARQIAHDETDAYVKENLNTECIDDYLVTNATDNCGDKLPTNGMYGYGFKQENGVLEKCGEPKKILAFDENTFYDEKLNPLATVDTVKRLIDELPKISIDGNKLTINGRDFRLLDWYDIFDYYVGWMSVDSRNSFYRKTREELINGAVFGNIEGTHSVYEETYGDFNLFYVVVKDGVNFDVPVDIDGTMVSSALISNNLMSPIKRSVTSILRHESIVVNNVIYTVYGVHTYRPNSDDAVRIVFSK